VARGSVRPGDRLASPTSCDALATLTYTAISAVQFP